MNLHALDWAIVAAYFAFSTIVGLVFTKRGGESLNEYFLSGRDVQSSTGAEGFDQGPDIRPCAYSDILEVEDEEVEIREQ